MKNDALRELLTDDMRRGDMSQSATRETSADRIGALAKADKLGAALWRTLATMDPATFIEARSIVIVRLREKHPSLMPYWLQAVAQRALEEWMAVGNPRGLLHRDRIEKLKLTEEGYDNLKQVFASAHKIIRSADRGVGKRVASELEHP